MRLGTPVKPRRSPFRWLFAFLMLAAVAWRLVGVTDWPVRFHPILQYDSAMAARTLWLSIRSTAPAPGREWWRDERPGRFLEPPILQTLTALTYLIDDTERPWVAALFSSAFWLAGGWFLLDLLRRLGVSEFAAAVSLGYYWLNPYGILISQSFQPEALLTLAFIAALWSMVRWDAAGNWRGALRCGAIAGLVGLAKPGILVLPCLGAYLGLTLHRHGLRRLWLVPWSYAFALLTVLPSLVYAAIFLRDQVEAKVLPQLWLDADFRYGWGVMMQRVVGWLPFGLACLGVLGVVQGRERFLGVGLAVGYLAYSLTFSYHSMTHDYYQLPLLVMVVLLMAPVIDRFCGRVIWERLTARVRIGVSALTAAVLLWFALPAANGVLRQRGEPELAQGLSAVGRVLGPGTRVISLSDHHSLALSYYGWLRTHPWPALIDRVYERKSTGRVLDDAERLDRMIAQTGARYVVVANFTPFHGWTAEFEALLRARYVLSHHGWGYIVFDLGSPRPPSRPAGE